MTSRPAPGRHEPGKRARRAESPAALMLRLEGYAILADHCRCTVGVVDLVTRRGHSLAMVEDTAFAVIPH